MPTSRILLKSARVFHLYSGVFFTPALLFFGFTGAVQSMNFHETTRGSNYKPPAILVRLAQLHKKETLVLPEHKAPAPTEQSAAFNARPQSTAPANSTIEPSHHGDHTNQQKHDHPDTGNAAGAPTSSITPPMPQPAQPQRKAPNTLPLKIFSFWAGIGLFLSTLTGLYMSYKYSRNKVAITAVLAVGLFLPLVLLYLQ